MPRALKFSILGVSTMLVVMLIASDFLPARVRAAGQQEGAYRQIGVYSEVLQHIESDYVEDPDITKVTAGALHGLLEGLDPESSYLSPTEYKAYKAAQGTAKAQVGLNIAKRYGYATVISVVPNSAADKAAVADGDVIEAIEGKSTHDLSVAMVRLMLQGQPGSSVTISLVRPRRQEPEKLTLTRTSEAMPPLAEQQYENSSILYLKPAELTQERVDAVINRLKEMPKANNKKVLLDLRDVAEGDMPQAVRLANAFVASGTIATLEGQKVPKQTFTADPKLAITQAPLVVLVNRGTAGPAELVAAAILDNKRGDVVGDHTFGEGAMQKLIEMPDGAALILSVAKYYGPDGKALDEAAVTPNVQVAAAEDDTPSVDELNQQPATPAPVQKVAHPDEQLNKALEVLRAKAA